MKAGILSSGQPEGGVSFFEVIRLAGVGHGLLVHSVHSGSGEHSGEQVVLPELAGQTGLEGYTTSEGFLLVGVLGPGVVVCVVLHTHFGVGVADKLGALEVVCGIVEHGLLPFDTYSMAQNRGLRKTPVTLRNLAHLPWTAFTTL